MCVLSFNFDFWPLLGFLDDGFPRFKHADITVDTVPLLEGFCYRYLGSSNTGPNNDVSFEISHRCQP